MPLAPNKPELRFAISEAVLEPDDVETMISAMATGYDVVRVPVPPKGGPDFFATVLELAYTTLVGLGPGIANSAIWDGLKLWMTRHRKIPSHYSPETYVKPNLEFVVEDRTAERYLRVSAVVRTDDEKTLQIALQTLPAAAEQIHNSEGRPYRAIIFTADDGGWDEPIVPEGRG